MDIDICRVNLRPSTLHILAELIFPCQRDAKSHRKHMEIGDKCCILFVFAVPLKFNMSLWTHGRHI